MIADWETNTIYFSELLKSDRRFLSDSSQLFSILDFAKVNYRFLPNTKDIWARDYMPVQTAKDKFIEYRYDPDYLQGISKGQRNIKTYPDIVCEGLGLKTIKTDLILDGGNIVKSKNCIILTEKVLLENKHTYNRSEIISKLHETFEIERVVIIPWEKTDIFGHTDSIIRFLDEDRVLLNYYHKQNYNLIRKLKIADLKIEYLNFDSKKSDKRSWAYLNFLQTKDLILVPKFDIMEDELAFIQIKSYFSDYTEKIFQVNMSEFVKYEGALNCISWTTLENNQISDNLQK